LRPRLDAARRLSTVHDVEIAATLAQELAGVSFWRRGKNGEV
jgi:hypothetical protein